MGLPGCTDFEPAYARSQALRRSEHRRSVLAEVRTPYRSFESVNPGSLRPRRSAAPEVQGLFLGARHSKRSRERAGVLLYTGGAEELMRYVLRRSETLLVETPSCAYPAVSSTDRSLDIIDPAEVPSWCAALASITVIRHFGQSVASRVSCAPIPSGSGVMCRHLHWMATSKLGDTTTLSSFCSSGGNLFVLSSLTKRDTRALRLGYRVRAGSFATCKCRNRR